jgi:hypothetical protein
VAVPLLNRSLILYATAVTLQIQYCYLLIKKYLKIPKGAIISRKSKKDIPHNGQKKKGQTTINEALCRKLKIEQHGPQLRTGG